MKVNNLFQPKATGEPKTKPTQSSVRELRGLGLSPDLILCRSEKPINHTVKEKISNFCHVAPEQVIIVFNKNNDNLIFSALNVSIYVSTMPWYFNYINV